MVFGGFAPETWRDMGERYYGNGTAAVWTFNSGGLQVHISSYIHGYSSYVDEVYSCRKLDVIVYII